MSRGRANKDATLAERRVRHRVEPIQITLRPGLPSPSVAWDAAAFLGEALRLETSVDRCEITVNANRRQVVSWRRQPQQLTLSVHWSLLEHVDDLVRLVTRGDRHAWSRLRRQLPREAPRIQDGGPAGAIHDLEELFARERLHIQRDLPPVSLAWGRWASRPPRHSLRLGSCDAGQPPLIRIHPVLDHHSVPAWFVGFVLYHELLHVVFPPIDRGPRRVVHPASFRAAERRHPHYEMALRWEQENLDDLLARARRQTRG